MLSMYCFIPVILPTLRRPSGRPLVPRRSRPARIDRSRRENLVAETPGARTEPTPGHAPGPFGALFVVLIWSRPYGPAPPPGHLRRHRPIVSEPLAITGIDEEILL